MPRSIDVMVVRVYMSEDDARAAKLEERLLGWGKVSGLTTFRGERGVGPSDSATTGPVVVEFFEEPNKAMELIHFLDTIVRAGHVVYWPARMRVDS